MLAHLIWEILLWPWKRNFVWASINKSYCVKRFSINPLSWHQMKIIWDFCIQKKFFKSFINFFFFLVCGNLYAFYKLFIDSKTPSQLEILWREIWSALIRFPDHRTFGKSADIVTSQKVSTKKQNVWILINKYIPNSYQYFWCPIKAIKK